MSASYFQFSLLLLNCVYLCVLPLPLLLQTLCFFSYSNAILIPMVPDVLCVCLHQQQHISSYFISYLYSINIVCALYFCIQCNGAFDQFSMLIIILKLILNTTDYFVLCYYYLSISRTKCMHEHMQNY